MHKPPGRAPTSEVIDAARAAGAPGAVHMAMLGAPGPVCRKIATGLI